MTRIIILFSIILFITLSSKAQHDLSDNQFLFNAGIKVARNVIPNASESPLLYGVEIANSFNLWNNESVGIALRTTWLDAKYGRSSSFFGDFTIWEAQLAKIGPSLNYDLANNQFVNVFFLLQPSARLVVPRDFLSEEGEDATLSAGATMGIGASYKFKALNVGIDYTFGRVRQISTDNPFTTISNMNGIRLFLGISI